MGPYTQLAPHLVIVDAQDIQRAWSGDRLRGGGLCASGRAPARAGIRAAGARATGLAFGDNFKIVDDNRHSTAPFRW
jgi:hypothetical protein